MTVGERIKETRNKLGLSQVSFAYKINVSKQTLYKYENNIITNIPSEKIEAIAELGNVSPAYLMGWKEKENTIIVDNITFELHEADKTQQRIRLQKVLDYYINLSEIGQKKALDNIEDLSKIYSIK